MTEIFTGRLTMTATQKSFEAEMASRLSSIESRARALGSNITRVCKATGIARATYERWMERAPQTVTKVDEMEAEVKRLEGLSRTALELELARKATSAAKEKARRAPAKNF